MNDRRSGLVALVALAFVLLAAACQGDADAPAGAFQKGGCGACHVIPGVANEVGGKFNVYNTGHDVY